MALLATNRWPGDGTTTEYTFSFSDGYIDKAYVKAAFEDPVTFARTPITLTSAMFVGPFQIDTSLGPSPVAAAPVGTNFLLYRDTPKTAPLVDFSNGARVTEANLDKVAKQSVHIAAETSDATQADAIADIVNSVGTAVTAASTASAAATSASASAASAAASAAIINPASFATAAQGAKADTAVQPAGLTSTNIVDASSIGRSILTALNAAAVRVALGFTTIGSNIVQAADSAAVRALLSLGSLALKASVATTDIDNGAVTPAKTQLGALPSFIRLYGSPTSSAGWGTTNTHIRRFTTTAASQGTDITYADSASLGALFTINVAGVYAITYCEQLSSAQYFGVSLNSSQLSTSIDSISSADRIGQSCCQSANTLTGGGGCVIFLPAGSLVRPHGNSTANTGSGANSIFIIQRIA